MKENKLAVVTGASSGIGADASRHLISRGYRVVMVARRKAELEKIAKNLGPQAFVEAYDLGATAEVTHLGDKIKSTYGIPDVIVNCAGAGEWKRIEDTPPAEAVMMMQAPYFAAYNMCYLFMKEMLARKSGVFIHVNSPAAFFPWPSSLGYAAARWALRGLHESLIQDLAGTGVRSCHFVIPKVDSPYFQHNPNIEDKVPGVSKLIPILTTDECGRIIAKLADRPRTQYVYPFLLRSFTWLHWICPQLTSWSLRATGAKRPKEISGL